MKKIPISDARAISLKSGARKVVIIAIDDEDYCITTYGKTIKECGELAQWAEGKEAYGAVESISFNAWMHSITQESET